MLEYEITNPGTREIADRIHCLGECTCLQPLSEVAPASDLPDWYQPGRQLHGVNNAYLIDGAQTLLFDTTTTAVPEGVLEYLSTLLGSRGLDYLVISHPEGPHAGNAPRILEEYPEATLVAPESGIEHELYGLSTEDRFVAPGDTIDLGTHEVEFVAPAFFDTAMHIWMFERTEEVLFPVDWFSCPHYDGECLLFPDEVDHDVPPEQFAMVHRITLPWLIYADPAKTDAVIEDLIDRYDPSMIAPTHGYVIRENAVDSMRRMKDVIARLSERNERGELEASVF